MLNFRTHLRFFPQALKQNPLHYEDLHDFITCYNLKYRLDRKETERFGPFSYDELMQRDKISLDMFWLRDESFEDTENLPDPDVLASEIVENLEAALEEFRSISEDLAES